jgi:tetratricopeptide (TPR) repeat protein
MWFVWYDRGLILYNIHQFESAADAFDKALSLNPGESDKESIRISKDRALAQIPLPIDQPKSVKNEPSSYEIRGQIATGNFEWNAQNFAGFYYDIDNDLSTEKITATITDGNRLQEPGGITYTTTAQKNDFEFEGW